MEGNGGSLNTYDPNSWIRLEDQSGRVSIAPVDGEPNFRDVADSPERSMVSRDGLRQGVESMRGDVENDCEITITSWQDIVGPNNDLDVAGDDLSDFTIQIDGLDKEAEDCVVEWQDAIRQIDDDEEIDFGPRGPKEPVKETSEPSPRVEDDGVHQTKSKKDKEDDPEITIDPEDTALEPDVDAEADVTLDQPVGQTETVDDTTTAETTVGESAIATEAKVNPRIKRWEEMMPEHRQSAAQQREKITNLTQRLADDPGNADLVSDLKRELHYFTGDKKAMKRMKDQLVQWKQEAGQDSSEFEAPEKEDESDDALVLAAQKIIEPATEDIDTKQEAGPPTGYDGIMTAVESLNRERAVTGQAAEIYSRATGIVANIKEKYGHTSNIVMQGGIKPHEMDQFGEALQYLSAKMRERSETVGRVGQEDSEALDKEISYARDKVIEWTDYYKGMADILDDPRGDWREREAGQALKATVHTIRQTLEDTQIQTAAPRDVAK